MKKLLSIILSISLIFTLTISPYAATPVNFDSQDLVRTTLNIQGETVEMKYHLEDGYITYAEIGSDIMEVKGNDVYFNGEYIATVEKQVSTRNNIQPRSGWVYRSTCPYGMPAEYNIDRGITPYPIELAMELAEISFSALLSVTFAMFSWESITTGYQVLEVIVEDLIELADLVVSIGSKTRVIMYDHVYSHPVVGTAFHKNVLSFSDGRIPVTAFSCWA